MRLSRTSCGDFPPIRPMQRRNFVLQRVLTSSIPEVRAVMLAATIDRDVLIFFIQCRNKLWKRLPANCGCLGLEKSLVYKFSKCTRDVTSTIQFFLPEVVSDSEEACTAQQMARSRQTRPQTRQPPSGLTWIIPISVPANAR